MDAEFFKKLIEMTLSGLALLGIVFGAGKYFGKTEVRVRQLETINKGGKVIPGDCDKIFICPYTEDIKDVRESVGEVQVNVAELKGTVAGIHNTVEFISTYLRNRS